MGLQEFLKKMWVSITGHDPEGMDGLYRMETADVGLPTDGDVRHKITAHSPVQAPPGVEYYKDANGDMAWKWARNTVGVMPVAVVDKATGNTDVMTNTQSAVQQAVRVDPLATDTEGVSLNSTLYAWKQDTVAITNNTANTTLVGKSATLAIEIMVHSVDVIMIDDANPIQPALAFQDEDDATCEGIDTVVCGTVYGDYTNGKLSGPAHWTFPWGIKAKTPAANKDLEVDLTGIGAAVGHILRLNYSWRYVPA